MFTPQKLSHLKKSSLPTLEKAQLQIERIYLESFNDFGSQDLFKKRGMIRSLEFMAKLQDRAPRHPIVQPGLVFDNFLLNFSNQYRTTRTLSHHLGVNLIPRVTFYGRSYGDYNPVDHRIFFSPLEDEVQWVLKSKKDLDWKFRSFQEMEVFNHSQFHDLNHQIIFRLVRPKQLRRLSVKEKLQFYTWVESLVRIRDYHFSHEMQKMARLLRFLGVSYVQYQPRPFSEEPPDSFEAFRFLLTFFYFEINRGLPPSHIKKHFLKAGLPFYYSPRLELHSLGFIHSTSPAWLRKQKRKMRESGFLPPEFSGKSYPKIEVQVSSPEQWLMSESEIKKVYHWYVEIFGVPFAHLGNAHEYSN